MSLGVTQFSPEHLLEDNSVFLPCKPHKVKSLSCVSLFATPWTVTYQAPLSMEFSRQEYWNGVPLPSLTGVGYHSFPFSGDLPDPAIEPRSPTLQAG